MNKQNRGDYGNAANTVPKVTKTTKANTKQPTVKPAQGVTKPKNV